MTVHGEPRMLIEGKLVEAESGRTYENLNPASEEVIGVAADADERDVHHAIAAARTAFDEGDWSTDSAFRRHCLEQLLVAMREAREEISDIVVAEAGSPVALLSSQVDLAFQNYEFSMQLTDSYPYEQELDDSNNLGVWTRRRVRREPIGVVGAITPWNFPFLLNVAKLAPALAAGNTVVVKPAPDTPWSGTIIGQLVAQKTDIPPGVINIVTSKDPSTIGAVLAADARVDMITFTGSTSTGRRILASGAETIKRVFLELGGKCAHIVLDDADFAGTIPAAAASVCIHGGQGCAIDTRLLLPRTRYEEGVELAKLALENVPYGDPKNPENVQGPQISAKQRERVLGYINKGRAEGGTVLVGGGRPDHLRKGFFVQPTLFVDVSPTATIAQQEIFGPVLVVIPYENDDDAIEIANNSVYGLAGSVTSSSEERAFRIAKRLRTGNVAVNGGMWAAPDAPYGGYKQSGLGREYGVQGFEEYLETKVVGFGAGV